MEAQVLKRADEFPIRDSVNHDDRIDASLYAFRFGMVDLGANQFNHIATTIVS